MRLVYPTPEQNEMLGQWIASRLECSPIKGHCLAALDEHGDLKAVIAFFNFRWPAIEAAFVSEDPRWALNRSMVAEALSYPFVQLNCKRVTAVVEGKNKRARKAIKRLGFIEEGKLRKAGKTGDAFIYGLLPEDFRLRSWKSS